MRLFIKRYAYAKRIAKFECKTVVNRYCRVTGANFPHWTLLDFLRFWALPDNHRFITGKSYLWAYKAAWLVYNKRSILAIAREEQISPLLLAGVAAAEVGGTPERLKGYGVLQFRQVIEKAAHQDNRWSNAVSVGAVAIQLRAVAETLGLDTAQLTASDQFQLANCLLDNDFNLRVVARHLRQLVLYDYPQADTMNLTDEQIIVAGSRYNRGVQRNKQDFLDSIHAEKGRPEREYSSYGRRILEKRKSIEEILRLAI